MKVLCERHLNRSVAGGTLLGYFWLVLFNGFQHCIGKTKCSGIAAKNVKTNWSLLKMLNISYLDYLSSRAI